MERLEKLINILKLTPHLQPELVKEATHRILSRSCRTDPQATTLLKPLIEILIQYCDNDDSAQRSLFNDHLNSVILTFQYQNYQLILKVLLNEVTTNGSPRTVTAALQRIPLIVNNVKPIELGCQPDQLLKALIEVARRSDDESVLRALDLALKRLMPYLDHYLRKYKEMQLLSNSLIEVLLRNLQHESSQTRRLAASSLCHICSNSDLQHQNTLAKLTAQLVSLKSQDEASSSNKFVGFCLCVREILGLAEQQHVAIVEMILVQIKSNLHDTSLVTAALETLKEMFVYEIDPNIISETVKLIVDNLLITESGEQTAMKEDVKVILQANALACIAAIVKQRPIVLDKLESIFLYRNHSDVAVRNQLISIIGNYIEASWRFPLCADQSTSCEKIRKLWVELRSILNDPSAYPDTLKSCVIAIKTCINTLLESDHCLHIIEYQDFTNLIQLYLRSNFKPFKIEVLNLFATLNYRTLHYLEWSHWSRMKARTAGSLTGSLQERIVKQIVIASLIDENQRIRTAATSALVALVPNLFITSMKSGQNNTFHRSNDPIVSLAQDLVCEHLVVLKQADEHINHFSNGDEPVMGSELHEKLCIRNDHKFLSSSIIQSYDNPYNKQFQSQIDITKSQHRVNITINLMYIVGELKLSIEESLDKGKVAISSLVRTLYELSLVYPVYQYSTSWDCRPSEYCECFSLLNFLLTYLENLTEPDVVVEDLEAYKNFLLFSHQLLYALCHESVLSEYEHQKMKPLHKRQANTRDGYWSDLTLKHPSIADMLDTFFTHLTKLLWLISYIIEEKTNPFNMVPKQTTNPVQIPDSLVNHAVLVSNRLLFGRVHKKLESSFKSSKKNLNQQEEKFYQILQTCLASLSSLLEFVGMEKSMEHVKDILTYLKITSPTCGLSSLICARQLLKSLFGINILALYQVDPNDWFEDDSWQSMPSNMMVKQENQSPASEGVYYHSVANPYKIFSSYYSMNCSQITPTSDKALAILNFESRRALKVRRRIEDRVKSLFEHGPNQLVPVKVRQISELLKNTISEFTPIVTECMQQFNLRGFCHYQSEVLHFMSYLILLRVNYQKLALAGDLIVSIDKLLEQCGEKVFLYRENGIDLFLRNSFTFLTLLSYERRPSKPMFQVATVIKKLDDFRAKLSMTSSNDRDISTYVVPLLRCLVEDLFIYRTKNFQNTFNKTRSTGFDNEVPIQEGIELAEKDAFEILEAERETVAQKLLDVIDNPKVYDLLSILILESRQNSSEIKYKKLSQHLLSIIPTMLSKRKVNLMDYRCVELTRRIIENISPEVFQPVNFIFETLLETPKPSSDSNSNIKQEFQRWMSLVIISIHILITQVKEEVFLSRLRETMSDETFVEYLLHIAQLCIAEILVQLYSPVSNPQKTNTVFLTQQLSSYILYLTHMFQSGLFFQLSRTAVELVKREIKDDAKGPKSFRKLCVWARDPENGFSLDACERMFCHIRLIYPDLTIFWCNVMMLLNNVDCNRDYWRNLLVYECHHCQTGEGLSKPMEVLSLSSSEENLVDNQVEPQPTKDESKFKRGATHINRPSSLNLSDISFSDQLRRSFIKKIAAAESRDKTFNRNIIETSDEDGRLLEREVSIGNVEQCLSPNIELTRRGALCLVLDFVTISMNDVEHITWLIIHHINDIIRWSHEMPITEFINAVHGNSASSGIFIQAINSGFNNLASISFVTRLLWTLEQVHYTQYGSLVVLLVEKLLSSEQLRPYIALTKKIEEFACLTVQKLLNETNKSLVTTNDEVVNQLTAGDLDRIYSILDVDAYPKLSGLLVQLRQTTHEQVETPKIQLHAPDNESDGDSEEDEIETLYSKVNLVYWLAEQNCTAHISSLIPALNTIKTYLSDESVLERINKDEELVCFIITAVYSLALNILPPPTRLTKPKLWLKPEEVQSAKSVSGDNKFNFTGKPIMLMDSKRKVITPAAEQNPLPSGKSTPRTLSDAIEASRMACLKSLFLFDNMDFLKGTHFESLEELVVLIVRLPMVNSFVLTPSTLWRQNIWPLKIDDNDQYKTNFPMVTFDIISKDWSLLESFCDRLVKLGWISRRQFEEAWMTLLGVLSTSLSSASDSNSKETTNGALDQERKMNLIASCKVVTTITKLLLLSQKSVSGNPLSKPSYPALSFDEMVIDMTRAIGSNLTSLRKRTKSILETIESEKRPNSRNSYTPPSGGFMSQTAECQKSGSSDYLRIPAQKLRMNAILNVELDMQDTVVIDSEQDSMRTNEVDTESCIRSLFNIYKHKFKDPNENFYSQIPSDNQTSPTNQQEIPRQKAPSAKNKPNQLAPPMATAICQSIVALSDLLTDYEQFDWLFETFVQMFKLAERNEDEIQMQYLIIGLCKSAAVCCYEIPNELTTSQAINHRDVMFEKCRQSIEKCVKSSFGPLKLNALFSTYYMLEDSINIVASGAWELDHFKQLRQNRLTWILKLMPVILDKENLKMLTKRPPIVSLLEALCECVTESELKAMKP